jgi:hypothetical protein
MEGNAEPASRKSAVRNLVRGCEIDIVESDSLILRMVSTFRQSDSYVGWMSFERGCVALVFSPAFMRGSGVFMPGQVSHQ